MLADITGQKFNRLTAIKYVGKNDKGFKQYLFKCDCGNEIVQSPYDIVKGRTKSCGCLKKENRGEHLPHPTTHGQSKTRLYAIWCSMKQRCKHNPKDSCYQWYKNVRLCKEWENFEPFYEWSMNNGYQEHLSIDRIDSKGNYEPSNCRWATTREQANNTSRNHSITYKGMTRNLGEWMHFFNKNGYAHYFYYHNKGWSDDEIFNYFEHHHK